MAEPNYRKLESKRCQQHYMTIAIRRLSGDTPEEIAASLKMTLPSVKRDLGWIASNWSRRLLANGEEPSHQISQPKTAASWLAKAICCNCSAEIADGEGRLVITALEIVNQFDDGGDAPYRKNGVLVPYAAASVEEVRIPARELMHCCEQCSSMVNEFIIRNPSFGQLAQRTAQTVSQDGAVEATEGMLIDGGRLTPAPDSGEGAQKAQLDNFLKAPRSRGMDQTMRKAAKMWVDGESQSEIAKKLRKDQSSISRILKAARQQAYAPF